MSRLRCLILYVCIYLLTFKNGVIRSILTEARESSKYSINLIWWTPFIDNYEERRTCGFGECLISDDRDLLNNLQSKAVVLFYGSNFRGNSVPHSRNSNQLWALLHEESPKNNPLLCHKDAISLFNFTSTYKQESSAPLPLQYLTSLTDLTSNYSNFYSVDEKNYFKHDEGLGSIIYIQSDCDTPSQRDSFVEELSTYIKIDSYGFCLNNKALPHHLRTGVEGMWHQDLKTLISKYKFSLALENAADNDYITEKLWRPLGTGTVPIYWGAPNIHSWIPNENSVVDVRNFTSVEKLAKVLLYLDSNDKQYSKYLIHKTNGVIGNKMLVKAMRERKWGINNDPERINFIDHFECEVCNAAYQETFAPADENEYNCKEPGTVMDHFDAQKKPPSHWVEEWHRSRHEAAVLRELLEGGDVFSPETYEERVLNRLLDEGHYTDFPPTLAHEEF